MSLYLHSQNIWRNLQGEREALFDIRADIENQSFDSDIGELKNLFSQIQYSLLGAIDHLDEINQIKLDEYSIVNEKQTTLVQKHVSNFQKNLWEATMALQEYNDLCETEEIELKDQYGGLYVPESNIEGLHEALASLIEIYSSTLEQDHQSLERLDYPQVDLYLKEGFLYPSRHKSSLKWAFAGFLDMGGQWYSSDHTDLYNKFFDVFMTGLESLQTEIDEIYSDYKKLQASGDDFDQNKERYPHLNAFLDSMEDFYRRYEEESSIENFKSLLSDKNDSHLFINTVFDVAYPDTQSSQVIKPLLILFALKIKNKNNEEDYLSVIRGMQAAKRTISQDENRLKKKEDLRTMAGYAFTYLNPSKCSSEGSINSNLQAIVEDNAAGFLIYCLKSDLQLGLERFEQGLVDLYREYHPLLREAHITKQELRELKRQVDNEKLNNLLGRIILAVKDQDSASLEQATKLLYILADSFTVERPNPSFEAYIKRTIDDIDEHHSTWYRTYPQVKSSKTK